MKRILTCVATLALLATTLAVPALAHAEFVSSTPSPGATLTTAPTTVTITFSEDLAAGSTANVFNASRLQVSTGATISTTDRKVLTVALRPNLANGGYTAFWHSISADDGDVLDDAFSFTIAVPTAAAPAAPAPTAAPGRLPNTSTDSDPSRVGLGITLLALASILGLISLRTRAARKG